MKQFISALVVTLALAGGVFASQSLATNDKVTICHAAGQAGTTQFVTLTITYNAAFGQAGHFNEDGTPRAGHEQDYLGPCTQPTATPSPSPTGSATATPTGTPTGTPTASPNATPTFTVPPTLPTCPPNHVGVAVGCIRTPTPSPSATATPTPTLIPPVTTTPAPTPVPQPSQLPNTSTE